MTNEISVAEVKILLKMCIELLEDTNRERYKFEFDSYWTITYSEWRKFEKVPEPGVGSLNEDIFYLREGIKNKDQFSFIDFDKIATVLKAISEVEAPVE